MSFQHSTPGVSYVEGAGGRRVAQTWLDGVSPGYAVNLVKAGAGINFSYSGTTRGINEVLIESTGSFPPTSGTAVNFDYLTLNFINNTFNFSGTNAWVLGGNTRINVNGSGFFVFNTPLQICGYQFWCCAPVSVSGTSAITNWNLPAAGAATMYTVAPDSPTTIAGIVPAYSGQPQLIGLVNISSGKELRLLHDDAGTDTYNEILLPSAWSGSSLSLFDGDTVILWWDECNAEKWRVISTTAELLGVGSYTPLRGIALYGYSGEAAHSALSGTWTQISGTTITLPSSGTYNLQANVYSTIQGAKTETIQHRFYNATTSGSVGQSAIHELEADSPGGDIHPDTRCITYLLDVTAATEIWLQDNLTRSVGGTASTIQANLIYARV